MPGPPPTPRRRRASLWRSPGAPLAGAEKPLLWVRQEALTAETGAPYPPGLAEIGLDPAAVAFIRVRDAKEALQAGAEAGRCATVGATLIELFGEARAYDLTASRRLALAAAAAGAPIFCSAPAPSPRRAPPRAAGSCAPRRPARWRRMRRAIRGF